MGNASRSVPERVIQKVSNSTGSDALELPLLYDVVDPDALDAFVERMSDGEITFTYAGHEVTVAADGSISLEERFRRRTPVGIGASEV